MPTLLIAYDIGSDGHPTAALAAAIRQLGLRWARPLASLWYIETDKSVIDIETSLASYLSDDDGLLIQEVIGQAALANTMLRWTGRSPLMASQSAAQLGNDRRPWQPWVVSGPVPASGHLPNTEREVAVAA